MQDADDRLPPLGSREEYFDFLDGRSVRVGEEIVERKLTGPVPKTYMLETVPDGELGPGPGAPFRHSAVSVSEVGSDELFVVHDARRDDPVGLLEWFNERHPVLYTLLPAKESDPWTRDVVDTDPWLDRLWLSAPTFERLWQYVETSVPGHRFTTLKFDHDAFYEVHRAEAADHEGDASVEHTTADDDADDDGDVPVERRKSVFTLSDRVGTVKSKLRELQDLYRPLESLVQLRIPGEGRGGHDFYFDGKVTNRSDSFFEHRQHAAYVTDLYRRSTDLAESHLWMEAEPAEPREAGGYVLTGAALVLRFSEPLSQPTFDRWLSSAFQRRRNRFRLSGRVFRRGPTKAHICALDRHLWQPLLLEATTRQLTAVLPRGTCGNTVHRLVTNVQRFLDPGVDAWLGERAYETFIGTPTGDS